MLDHEGQDSDWSTPRHQEPGGRWVSEQVSPTVLEAELEGRGGSLGLLGWRGSLSRVALGMGSPVQMGGKALLAHEQHE